jgi:hypothetical protein
MSWYASYKGRDVWHTGNTVNTVTDERAADEAAERAAIQSEPTLPALGTPARTAHDAAQREMVAGLMTVASQPSGHSEHLKKGIRYG